MGRIDPMIEYGQLRKQRSEAQLRGDQTAADKLTVQIARHYVNAFKPKDEDEASA